MAEAWSITLTGAEMLISIFNTVSTPTFMRGVSNAAFSEANVIMNKSKAVVPIEDGILRGSATVKPVEVSGQMFSVTIGYGGAASAYALIQHENMAFHHPGLHSKRKNQTGRKAKYLEDPVNEALPGLEAKLASSVLAYFLQGGI